MARCGCGGPCSCSLTPGDNVQITGTGSATSPWVVNAVTNCPEVRACHTSGDGTVYDPADGSFDVCVSPTVGNLLTQDANGCLLVNPGTTAVVTGCGIQGNGLAGTPLAIEGKAWPFACTQDSATADGVYCDPVTGLAHGDPRKFITQVSGGQVIDYAPPVVIPTPDDTVVDTLTLDITNPDPCRSATVMVWRELDTSIDAPPNSGGTYGINGDDMVHIDNTGTSTMMGVHTQVGNLLPTTLGPGASTTLTLNFTAARGFGGAVFTRVQFSIRAWIFSTP